MAHKWTKIKTAKTVIEDATGRSEGAIGIYSGQPTAAEISRVMSALARRGKGIPKPKSAENGKLGGRPAAKILSCNYCHDTAEARKAARIVTPGMTLREAISALRHQGKRAWGGVGDARWDISGQREMCVSPRSAGGGNGQIMGGQEITLQGEDGRIIRKYAW